MPQQSCAYFCFVLLFFLSLFIHSQDSAVLRDFLRLSGRDLHRDHPSHAAHPEQLQAHLAGPSCTSRWESCFLFVTVPSERAGLSESKGHALWNELPEWTNTAQKQKKGRKKKGRESECSTNCGALKNRMVRTFVNRICYLRSFMTSRCFINNPTVAFSPN